MLSISKNKKLVLTWLVLTIMLLSLIFSFGVANVYDFEENEVVNSDNNVLSDFSNDVQSVNSGISSNEGTVSASDTVARSKESAHKKELMVDNSFVTSTWFDGETVLVEEKPLSFGGSLKLSSRSVYQVVGDVFDGSNYVNAFPTDFVLTDIGTEADMTLIDNVGFGMATDDDLYSDLIFFDSSYIMLAWTFIVDVERVGSVSVVASVSVDTTDFLSATLYLDIYDFSTSQWDLTFASFNGNLQTGESATQTGYVLNQFPSLNLNYGEGSIQDGSITVRVRLKVESPNSSTTRYFLDYVGAIIDQLSVSYSTTSIYSNVLSKYKYSSSTIMVHELELQPAFAGSTMRIYSPLSWNFSSSTPGVNLVWDDTNQFWYFSNVETITYVIRFISGDGYGVDYARKPQILAISDYSSDYTQRGFESGTFDGWSIYNSATQPDSFELSTNIVFDGSFSARITDSDSAGAGIGILVDDGYYYVAFNYYVQTATQYFKFYYYDGSWKSIDLDRSVKNRWISFFYYIHVDGSYTYDLSTVNVAFYELAGTGTLDVYIDNFRIYKPSTQIRTDGLDEYTISGTLRSWDNRQNPPMPKSNVQIQLRDRTANTLVRSWSDVATDSSGVFSVTYSQSLQEKEYEIRVWTYNDYFLTNDFKKSDLFDSANWLHYEAINEYSDHIVIERSTGNTKYDKSTVVFDFSQIDMFYLDFEFNRSLSFYVFLYQDVSNYYRYLIGSVTANERTTFLFNIESYDYVAGNPSLNNIDYFGFVWIVDPQKLTVYELKPIHAVKYYFTPLTASQSIYQYSEGQEWDFSEETQDGFSRKGGTPEGGTGEGYIWFTADSDWDGFSIGSLNSLGYDVIGENEVDYFIFRFWSNASDHAFYLYLNNPSDSDPRYLGITTTIANNWVTVSGSFTPPTGGIDDIRIEMHSSGTASYPVKIKIDFIRLVHTKSNSIVNDTLYVFPKSENNSLTYNLFHDGENMGLVNDLDLEYLRYDYGSHNITYVPVMDSVEDFPGVFVSGDVLTFLYEKNPPSLTLGLFDTFYDKTSINLVYFTNWGNTSFTLYQNSTKIGNGTEGFAIISYVQKVGVNNFTYVIDGGAQSIVIQEFQTFEAQQALKLSAWSSSYDQVAGSISLYFETNWGNASLKAYLNGSLLGSSSNEGSFVIQFSKVAGVNNFTYVIDGGFSLLVITELKTFPVSESLKVTAWSNPVYEFQINMLSLYFETNWGNTSIKIYQNGTLLGSFAEGNVSAPILSYSGSYNFTYFIDGGFESVVVQEWVSYSRLDLDFIVWSDPNYDLGSGILSTYYATTWGNTSMNIYQNGSLLGYTYEGSGSVNFFTEIGTWNFTYFVNGGSQQIIIEEIISIEYDNTVSAEPSTYVRNVPQTQTVAKSVPFSSLYVVVLALVVVMIFMQKEMGIQDLNGKGKGTSKQRK